jgi:nucleotide-binding universal stress UspA family protein
MSNPPKAGSQPGAIERVVVPLDAAAESGAAIDTAARLAARAHAPLHGIFVEDEDLLNLAGLPFTRQTTLGAAAEGLTHEHVTLHLRIAAERAKQELLAAAKRHGVKATFEVVRGASASALAAVSEHDLVIAGGLTRPIGAHFRLACRWWSSLEMARGPFLLTRQAWAASGSVVMLLRDRSPAAARLLDAAAQIAEATDRNLTVICPPTVARAPRLDKWISDRLANHPARLQIEIGPAEPAELLRRLGELDCRLLAVEASIVEGGSERLRELVERFACDVLVVR